MCLEVSNDIIGIVFGPLGKWALAIIGVIALLWKGEKIVKLYIKFDRERYDVRKKILAFCMYILITFLMWLYVAPELIKVFSGQDMRLLVSICLGIVALILINKHWVQPLKNNKSSEQRTLKK